MWTEEKNATHGNLISWVSTKQFCTKTLGLHEWFRYRPMFPTNNINWCYVFYAPENLCLGTSKKPIIYQSYVIPMLFASIMNTSSLDPKNFLVGVSFTFSVMLSFSTVLFVSAPWSSRRGLSLKVRSACFPLKKECKIQVMSFTIQK